MAPIRMIPKIKASKGQGLIEVFVTLPLVLLVGYGVLMSCYFILVTYWSDFWVYRSTLCLVEQKTKHHCERQLVEKLKTLIPEKNFFVRELWITAKKAKTNVDVDFHFDFGVIKIFQKRFDCEIILPLVPHKP